MNKIISDENSYIVIYLLAALRVYFYVTELCRYILFQICPIERPGVTQGRGLLSGGVV